MVDFSKYQNAQNTDFDGMIRKGVGFAYPGLMAIFRVPMESCAKLWEQICALMIATISAADGWGEHMIKIL